MNLVCISEEMKGTKNGNNAKFDILTFSSAWLCQPSSWNRNSSFVRPSSVLQLSLYLMHGFVPNARISFPIGSSDFFWIFEKSRFPIFYDFFLFIYLFSLTLTRDPMEVKISKLYSYKSQSKVFKLALNISMVLHDNENPKPATVSVFFIWMEL